MNPRALAPAESYDGGATVPQPGGALDATGFRFTCAMSRATATGSSPLPLDAAVLAHSRGPIASLQRRACRSTARAARSRTCSSGATSRSRSICVSSQRRPIAEELKRAPGRQLSIYEVTLPVSTTSRRHAGAGNIRARVSAVGAGGRRAAARIATVASRGSKRSHQQRGGTQTRQRGAPALSLRSIPSSRRNCWSLSMKGTTRRCRSRSGAAAAAVLPRPVLPAAGTRFVLATAGRHSAAAIRSRAAGAASHGRRGATVVSAAGGSGPAASSANEFIPLPLFWGLLGAAVLVILGLIVRLVKQ